MKKGFLFRVLLIISLAGSLPFLSFPTLHAEPAAAEIKNSFLTPVQKEEIRRQHLDTHDPEYGGWGTGNKQIDADEMEHAMIAAAKGDQEEETRVLKTLDNALLLLDPVKGGFYQYSTQRDWKSPQDEKTMEGQAYSMRLYSMAGSIFKKPEYLEAARKTAKYLKDFRQDPGGAFYVKDDADPQKDLSPRENGLAIVGLTAMYHATLEKEYLDQSIRAAEWILKNRVLEDSGENFLGFRSEEKEGVLLLSDTLMMARAFLRLYASTGNREWFGRAAASADFIEKKFRNEEGGYLETTPGKTDTHRPRSIDENRIMARFANLLWHYSGKKEYRAMAEHAMRYLALPETLEQLPLNGGTLLADQELASAPMHVTIVGHKDDPAAQALFAAALNYPMGYKRLEWWDKREGPLPNPDVTYPELPEAAAFVCSGQVCSLPVFKPERVAPQMDRLRKKDTGFRMHDAG